MSANDGGQGFLAAMIAMALVTGFVRVAGFWLMRYIPITPRVKRVLDAMPGSVIIAAILPGALRGGPVQMLAVGVAVVTMLVVRNDFVAVVAAVVTAAAARFFL
jgi:uncharacterized membrane protein